VSVWSAREGTRSAELNTVGRTKRVIVEPRDVLSALRGGFGDASSPRIRGELSLPCWHSKPALDPASRPQMGRILKTLSPCSLRFRTAPHRTAARCGYGSAASQVAPSQMMQPQRDIMKM
jgi:hypothetical protein